MEDGGLPWWLCREFLSSRIPGPHSSRLSTTFSVVLPTMSTDLDLADGFSGVPPINSGVNELELDMRDCGGVVRIHRFSRTRGQADRAVKAGRAIRMLPGVVADAGRADDSRVKMQAIHMWHRDAVIIGKAALVAQGMIPPGSRTRDFSAIHLVEAFSRTRGIKREGILVHRWRVPRRYVTQYRDVPMAIPEASVLLLAVRGEWEWVCEALRQKLVTPRSCRSARSCLSWKFGRHRITAALADISFNPWSVPELWLSRALRAVGFTGWHSNTRVDTAEEAFTLDQAFDAERVGVEVDGRCVHGTPEGYEATMMRSASLDRHGWRMLHITPTMLRQRPRFVLEWLAQRIHKRHRPKVMMSDHELSRIMLGLAPT